MTTELVKEIGCTHYNTSLSERTATSSFDDTSLTYFGTPSPQVQPLRAEPFAGDISEDG